MSFRRTRRRSSAVLQLDGNAKILANRRLSVPSMEPLEDMVTCPIDLNLLVDPRLLPCGHAFCCDCLTHYMCQLSAPIQAPTHSTFACPICRTDCVIPHSKSATSFPKAFNHIVILEFLHKSQMANYKTPTAPPLPTTGSGELELNGGHYRVPQARKTSIQVSSHMLNYLVNDITSRQRDGRIEAVDRAVIVDEVSKLLQQLEPSAVLRPDVSQPQTHIQNKGSRGNKKGASSTSSSSSPTSSNTNLGRFQSFAGKVRSARRRASSVGTDHSYMTYRDVESVRLAMRSNSIYFVLTKGKDCCIMRPGELFQPVDMQMLPLPNSTQSLRCTLTTTKDRTNLVMWHQNVDLTQAGLLADAKRGKHSKSILVQSSGPVKVPGFESTRIQYIRFYKNKIFLTGIINLKQDEGSLETEFGLVICCQATSLMDSDVTEKADIPPTEDPFPILATSCIFRRDSVGMQLRDEPIVGGLDIDQSNGDIYLSQPANAMICRLKSNDLSCLDGTWYLNEPQLSPHFLCYVSDVKQIWATCQREDKMIILDLETNGYYHFTPTVSFGIDPSHIINTSDGRIVVLDQSQSRMFWISKVRQTICVQCLDVQFTTRNKRQFFVIQPVDDTISEGKNLISSNSETQTHLRGGILCAHDHGCSVIYPKTCLNSQLRTFNFDCTSLFSCGV